LTATARAGLKARSEEHSVKRPIVTVMGVVLLSAVLGGCAAKATQIYGRDGNPYHYIECPGPWTTLDNCYEKANEVCPAGYRIDNDVAPRDSYSSSLIVRCK
jgi:hypothetical protein